MSAGAKGAKARWAWAAGSALGAAVFLLALFSAVRPPAPPAPTVERSVVRFDRSKPGSALKDEATLLDPAPLFLPTEWNAAQKDVAWPKPGQVFQNHPIQPKFSFTGIDLKLELPPPVATPAKPADVLTVDAPGALAQGFGRAPEKIEPLPVRGSMVEIVATRTGLPALSAGVMAQVEALAAEARPPAGPSWQPMEFLAGVDSTGLSGPLVIVARSGVEDVDNYFKNYLVQTMHLGERLSPGFYRISVGP